MTHAGELADAYDRHAGGLYRYALLLLTDPGLAEDAVHQAFTKLASSRRPLSQIDSIEHYLRVAVRNECYRLLQSRRTTISTVPEQSFLESLDASLESDDQRRLIEAALRKLPPDQREIIHLKIYEDHTFDQIAHLLDIPPNTAASRYRYAMEKLRIGLQSLQPNRAGE